MLEALIIVIRGEREMELRYKSTRSNSEAVSASQAILQGLAQDGGLYVLSLIHISEPTRH